MLRRAETAARPLVDRVADPLEPEKSRKRLRKKEYPADVGLHSSGAHSLKNFERAQDLEPPGPVHRLSRKRDYVEGLGITGILYITSTPCSNH